MSSVSITIKPGTYARNRHGRWFAVQVDFDVVTIDGVEGWWIPCPYSPVYLDKWPFDCSSFPTFAEPDWRKTKFQVQQSPLPCEVELIQQVKDRKEADYFGKLQVRE